ALPDGVQAVSDPLEGYKIVPIQWTGSIEDGADPITLSGTAEDIVAQIQTLNPDYVFTEDNSTEAEIEKRSQGHIICKVGGRGAMDVRAARRERDYLCSLGNNVCHVGAGPRIPWDALPPFPPDPPTLKPLFPYMFPVPRQPRDIKGVAHHQSLKALQSSAKENNCSICRLILNQVESYRSQLEELQLKWESNTRRKPDWPTWELWIVKRGVGGDGFWVMSFTDGAERKRGVTLVAAVGICVRDGDPLESVICGRPVEEQGGSLTAISRARSWVKACNEHPSCRPNQTVLPTRVIDMGNDIHNPYVKLRETGGNEHARYIALSYCWGKAPGSLTTKSTLEDRKQQISIYDLPKTHQDTIHLSRQLGIRYLWIDSICIFQDDLEDWDRESANMLSIYSNAYLTVCASRSTDSSGGLFGERPAREYVEVEYVSGAIQGKVLAFNLPIRDETQPGKYITLPDEPLSHRGWALQERILSRRMLLYGSQQMYFKCNQGFRSEDGVSLQDRSQSIYNGPDELSEVTKQTACTSNYQENNINECKAKLLVSWHELVWVYGPQKLTRASDKLPAISGLASIFSKQLGDEYIVGLWRSYFIEGLLWLGLRCRRTQEYRAPSWSWVSIDGIPGFGPLGIYDTLAEVLDVQVDLRTSNPYGEVTSGKIKIQAPIERLYFTTEDWDPTQPSVPYYKNPKVRTAKGSPEGTFSRFDFDFAAEDAAQEALRIVESLEGVEFFALILVKAEQFSDPYRALIIRQVEGGDEYQRLGVLNLHRETLGRRPEEEAKDDLPIITLI
ncbi:tol protein, partial [Fusarium langsethiae]